jgi:hypothetical protein
MMSEFTKGPLTIHGPSQGGTPCDDGGDFCIRDSEGKIIGEAISKVGRVHFKCSGPEYVLRPAEANAQLWAAAPALYAVAQAIIEVGDLHGFDAGEILAGLHEAGVMAEEAIALADGEGVNDE